MSASGPNLLSMDQSCERLTVTPRARSCCIASARFGNLLKKPLATIAPPARIIGIAAAVGIAIGLDGTVIGKPAVRTGKNWEARVDTSLTF